MKLLIKLLNSADIPVSAVELTEEEGSVLKRMEIPSESFQQRIPGALKQSRERIVDIYLEQVKQFGGSVLVSYSK